MHSDETISKCTAIEVDFENWGDYRHTLCYSDEDALIFSLGNEYVSTVDISVETEKLLLFDRKEEKVKFVYDVLGGSFITDAVPDKDGILYVDYSVFEDNSCQWQLILANLKGKNILDSGISDSYEMVPIIQMIDGVPVYLICTKSEVSCGFVIKKIVDYMPYIIVEKDDYELINMQFASNGKEYCFVSVKGTGTSVDLLVGDLLGLKHIESIDGALYSFGINEQHAVYSAVDNESYFIETVDLATDKASKYDMGRPLYRLTGTTGLHCLCVDMDYNVFSLDLTTGTKKSMDLLFPEKLNVPVISFYPSQKNGYIISYNLGERFYELEMME